MQMNNSLNSCMLTADRDATPSRDPFGEAVQFSITVCHMWAERILLTGRRLLSSACPNASSGRCPRTSRRSPPFSSSTRFGRDVRTRSRVLCLAHKPPRNIRPGLQAFERNICLFFVAPYLFGVKARFKMFYPTLWTRDLTRGTSGGGCRPFPGLQPSNKKTAFRARWREQRKRKWLSSCSVPSSSVAFALAKSRCAWKLIATTFLLRKPNR